MADSALVSWGYAQTARTTSGPIGLGSSASTIAALRAAMGAGQPVYAVHVNMLVDLYNTWTYHYHTMSDLHGVDTYGTWGLFGGGVWVANSTSNTGHATQPYGGGVAAGQSIATGGVNHTINVVNLARNHAHTYTDSYWP